MGALAPSQRGLSPPKGGDWGSVLSHAQHSLRQKSKIFATSLSEGGKGAVGAIVNLRFFLLFLPEGLIKEHQAHHHGDAAAGDEAIGHIEHGKIDEFRGDHIHHEA